MQSFDVQTTGLVISHSRLDYQKITSKHHDAGESKFSEIDSGLEPVLQLLTEHIA